MSLKALIDSIEAKLIEAGVTGVTFKLGGEHIHEHTSASRVVWVPRRSTGGAPVKLGTNPRQLGTRRLMVDAHIWGFDTSDPADHYTATEALLEQVAAAAHHAAHGSYSFNGEDWPEMNGELLAYGRVVLVSFTFDVPINDAPVATKVVTSVPITSILTVPS